MKEVCGWTIRGTELVEADGRVGGEDRLFDLHMEHNKWSEIVEDDALG